MNAVLQHYLIVALSIIINFGLASGIAWIITVKVPNIAKGKFRIIVTIVGTIILLIAAIGRLGQTTWNGNTDAEHLDNILFWILSYLGSFLIFFEIMCGLFRRSNEC